MKVVINKCCGVFSLSEAARKRYLELAGERPADWLEMDRTDKILVQVVEELGPLADGNFAELAVEDIPSGKWYRIETLSSGRELIRFRDNDDDWKLST